MANIQLTAAGQVEKERIEAITAEDRPMFHLTPYCGWMSDSNGFSFYKGEYHLFYLYNPCKIRGGEAHWGHAVSSTLFDWKHMPVTPTSDALRDADRCDRTGNRPIPKELTQSCKRWEGADFFELDGTSILLANPIEIKSRESGDQSGSSAAAICGDYDSESGTFTPVWNQPIDYGNDFYYPQTLLTPDGRRVMIASMQNRDAYAQTESHALWAGQMTIPRELYVKEDRLCQTPVRELKKYYTNVITYNKVPVSDEVFLYGMESRCTDLEITVRPVPGESCYREFAVWFAMDDENHSTVSYTPENGMVKIGREHSGSRKQDMYQCGCLVKESMDGNIKIRIILDRFSLEVFINDGRYVMSSAISTSPSAERIAFHAEGRALIDVTKRDICI